MRIEDIPVQEENYDAGRSQSTFCVIDHGYKSFANFGKTGIVLTARYRSVHQTFRKTYRTWQLLNGGHLGEIFKVEKSSLSFADYLAESNPNENGLHAYHFLNEMLVFQIRKFFETYLQMCQIHKFRETAGNVRELPSKIQLDSLGKMENGFKKSGSNALSLLFYGIKGEHSQDFQYLSLINRLGNATRHHPYFDDVYNLVGIDGPTLVGIEHRLDATSSKATYYNHNAFHVMMGFQDVTDRILTRSANFFA